MRKLHLILQQLARMEKQQELEEAIAEVQRRIDLLEEVMLSWRLPAEEEADHAKEFHNVNPFEGRILWSS